MSTFEVVLLACALAVDAFSVGAVVGLRHREARQVFRLSLHFGIFQALFPLVGALASRWAVGYIQAWDHWIVFVVLGSLGVRMIVGAIRGETPSEQTRDLTKGMRLVGLSTAVSIDALAAGLVISATNTPLAFSVTIIGLVAAAATAVAMLSAGRVSEGVGRRAEAVGGLVLIAIGLRTLITDLSLFSS